MKRAAEDDPRLATAEGETVRPGIPRAVEAALALVGLAVSAPVVAVAAAVVAVTSRGPAFFRQERVGRGGKTFPLCKLRTMRLSSGGWEVTARDDARVTRFGRFLRRAKLDELPQLWNVLCGDMALVGPRPEVPRYVDLDNPLWRKILQARPGITDPVTMDLAEEESLLAQVPGDREQFYREELQPAKLRECLAYLQRRSWRTDLQVLCRTGLALVSLRKPRAPRLTDLRDSKRKAAE